MKIEVVRVPQYMSKNVNVIMVDGKPICTCRGAETTAIITATLEGYPMNVLDGRIAKKIMEVRNDKNRTKKRN
jgi:hypothetical protein